MKRLLLAAVLAVLAGSSVFAGNVPCTGIGPTPANPLAVGSTFSCGPFSYQVLLINPTTGASSATISVDASFTAGPPPSGSWFDGEAANIGLILGGLNTLNGVGDIQFEYLVTGPQTGFDLAFTATTGNGPNANVTITEKACNTPLSNGNCTGIQYGNLGGTSTGSLFNQSVTFPTAVNQVYIYKDISFTNATMSEFTNSNEVPEPATLMLLGAALVALGVIKLRKKA